MQQTTTSAHNLRQAMSNKVKIFRYLALVCHISLLAWMAIWYLLLSSEHGYSYTFVIAMFLLPLIFPLYGVLRAKPYTHAWACFIVLWYFLHAITVMYAEPSYLVYALLELTLAIGMFVGCCMFAKLRGQELGTGLPKLSEVMAQEKASFERVQQNESNQ